MNTTHRTKLWTVSFLSAVLVSTFVIGNTSLARDYQNNRGPGSFALQTPSVTCVDGAVQVALAWGKSDNATSYTVERQPANKRRQWEVISTLQVPTVAYTDSSLAGQTGMVAYRIVAHSGHRTRSSNVQRVELQTCISTPLAASLFSRNENDWNNWNWNSRRRSSSSSSTPRSSSSSSKSSSSASSSSSSKSSSSVSSSSSSKSSSSSVSSSSSSSSMSSSSSSSSSSTSGMTWGAYVGDSLTDAAAFESLVGKHMNMQAIFVGGADGFPSEYGPTVRDQGKTLVVFWEPTGSSLDSIIAGNMDSAIAQFVAGAKSYGGPVIFVPFHEMNGNWDSWDGTVGNNTAAKEIAAWRHVHDKFAGATNVKFGWAVNSDSVPDTAANSITAYYPGADYVDYVGVDGFNFDSPWQTFSQVFGSALSTLNTYGKPEIIFSMASAQGTQKAAWITDALSTQLASHSQITGWIWFNENKEKDWRVNSDAASLQSFKTLLP